MSNNARTGISSAALRYIKLLEQNEENGDANLESMSSDVYNKLIGDEDNEDDSFMAFAENKEDSFEKFSQDRFLRHKQMRQNDSPMNLSNNLFAESHEQENESSFLKSFNNPFTENFDDNQNDCFTKSFDNFFDQNVQNPVNNQMECFTNVLDSTDVLIDDSVVNSKRETAQMSFMYSRDDENSIVIPTDSAKSFEFGSNSSPSNPSPPIKRFCYDRKNSFFNDTEQSGTCSSFFNHAGTKDFTKLSATSESFFGPARNNNNNSTDDSFCEHFLNKSFLSSYSVNDNRATDSLFGLSQSTGEMSNSDNNSTIMNVMSKAGELSNQKNSDEFMDQDVNKENGTTTSGKKIKKVNTFYQAPPILDTEKIDEFYKTHNSIDWKSDKINLDILMEPSLDYILHRLKCLKPLTTGRVDDSISYEDEDDFNCESINQGIDEIEDTFDKGKFICSTPEELENAEENIKTNPLNIGYMNFPSDVLTSTNHAQEDENDDNNTTKSLLINKDSEIVWSAITHVSCSVPLNEQDSSEPIFDITTIFDFPNLDDLPNEDDSGFKFLDNDTTRYELMLSILKDCNNPFDKTTSEVQETIKIAESRKAAIMTQIEMLIQALVSQLTNKETMIIKLHRIKDWKDCKYESNVLSQKETAIKVKSLSFTNKNTERTFTIIVQLLGEIYKLLALNTTCTKRELYYRDVELMKSQCSVNKAIDEICTLLNVQCWELGVLSTSKGLVAGDLRIVTDEDEFIDYSTTNSVPQKPSGIKSMESNAEFVLVVEKDTVFTRLIEDNIMEKIGRKIILVTAKGYPDINTRVLLKRFEMELQKPIYIIVDADAFGIDIMCTYKFGSLQMVKFSEQLAIPTMEWIGIYPTDIEKLDITRTQLTDADVKKVGELLARPYINDHLKTELEHLKNRGLKAEIESIYHFSIDYLIYDYIPQKIAAISSPLKDIIRESGCFKEDLFS